MSHFARKDGRNRKLRLERLESREMLAGDLELVRDINANTPGSGPGSFVSAGDYFYYVTAPDSLGQELWRSDGSTNGTQLLKRFEGSYLFPDFGNAANVGGRFYFPHRASGSGDQLWTSDGTAAGTRFVKDLHTGYENFPGTTVLIASYNKVYFTAWDEDNGVGLWAADATGGEPTLIKGQLSASSDYRTGVLLTRYRDGVAFVARNGFFGANALWVTYGTTASTTVIASNLLAVHGLTSIENTLYFAEEGHFTGNRLWTSDGTAAGTTFYAYASLRSSPVVVGNKFYFLRENSSDLAVWESDGTASGTRMVGDLDDYVNTTQPPELVNVSGVLYVSAESDGAGRELWKLDSSSSSLQLITDINTLPGFFFPQSTQGSNPRSLTNVNGTLYFKADNGISGAELWKSDGSVPGTVLVKDIWPGLKGSQYTTNSRTLVNHRGTLYFAASDETHGTELWRSDGTAAGTTLVKDLNTRTLNSLRSSHQFANLGGQLLFAGSNGLNDLEIWKSDGSSGGTIQVSNIRNGARQYPYFSPGTGLGAFVELNGVLYFGALDANNDAELWRTDGSAAGTYRLKDIFANSGATIRSSGPSDLVNVNGTLFFAADDGLHGRELWKSDGTTAGTVLVKDIALGEVANIFPTQFTSSYLTALTNVNGVLFFIADNGLSGLEVWRSDGTAGGTYQVKDLLPDGGIIGRVDRYNFRFHSVGSTAYFWASVGGTSGLWKSDGTSGGTQFVTEISLRPYTQPVLDYLGHLYFVGVSATDSASLFRVDRNSGAVSVVVDPDPNVVDFGWSSLTDLTVVGEAIYFRFSCVFGTPELWKTDGTLAGTTKLSLPCKLSTIPLQASSDDTFYFNVQNGRYETELWQTDGTSEGTSPVRMAGNLPVLKVSQVHQIGSRVYFAGYRPELGDELFSIDLTKTKRGDYNGTNSINKSDHARWRTSFGATAGLGLSADGNGDGVVDAADYTIWRENIQPFPGDFDQNGSIDTTDHLFWRNHVGDTSGAGLAADANFDNVVDAADYTIWRDAYVPQPFIPDYNRDYKLTSADGAFWAANFGATSGPGLQADGNSNNVVDAADYTLWRDAFIRPAALEPAIAVASTAVSSEVPAKPTVARPIATSPPRRTDLLLAARDAAFADFGRGEFPSITTPHKPPARKIAPAKMTVKPKL